MPGNDDLVQAFHIYRKKLIANVYPEAEGDEDDEIYRPLNIPGENANQLYPRWLAELIEEEETAFRATGNGELVLGVIRAAGYQLLPPPRWCLQALEIAQAKWHSGKQKNFGKAFGIVPKRGAKPRHQAPDVVMAVEAAYLKGKPLSRGSADSAFAYVGDQLGLTASQVETIYYSPGMEIWAPRIRGIPKTRS